MVGSLVPAETTISPGVNVPQRRLSSEDRIVTAMRVTDIAFTLYPVTDLKRARQFYETTWRQS